MFALCSGGRVGVCAQTSRRPPLAFKSILGCCLLVVLFFFFAFQKRKYRSFDLGHSIGVTFDSEKVQFDGASSRNK